ncbi:MAG: type II toxin-antitoxin system RelE/ParE family toxin [Atopobiaceae bacterium]|jgi:plasmid stabilization system protein ParE|nr:type II toxin-antitoxin system RelE/ParE family toxin [Atopobiaceae bacterium]MCH4276014.1 type II toxin-antitoxin system RelE/ParE family toxin [Atopobiaceae bacterium]MCI1225771.1 type II toxin-antitoxin system RelE/ParE family toxin [Atopobiaceae bacterium]MCI1259935.1 type II toxin-antitoxin system RelE/ParE family toxin [Atopobiaceae bacterium]
MADVSSDRILERLLESVHGLSVFPEMGSRLIRETVIERFGEDIRKLVVSPFVIIYRYDGNQVVLLDVLYGPRVR